MNTFLQLPAERRLFAFRQVFHYPTVFEPGAVGYVRPVVKIELGARSDDWPHEEKSIQPYVIEHFPALDPDSTIQVRVFRSNIYRNVIVRSRGWDDLSFMAMGSRLPRSTGSCLRGQRNSARRVLCPGITGRGNAPLRFGARMTGALQGASSTQASVVPARR